MTEYKSQTMRDIAAKRQAGALADFARIKERVEVLDGTRGTDRAMKQSDVTDLAKVGMNSPKYGSTIDELRADVQRLFDVFHKFANIYPSKKTGYRPIVRSNK